jgi:uncharacterized DUF497 family protein
LLDRLSGFDWDVHNICHVALHGVSPAEVEEATTLRHMIIPAAPGKNEKRWKLFGKTTVGRHLVVVFTIRLNKMRTVTAYTMNQAERKLYAPQIDA